MTATPRKRAALIAAAVLGFGLAAAPAIAEPPSWAPAHGWRAKHGHDHHRHAREYEYEYEYESEYERDDDDYYDDRDDDDLWDDRWDDRRTPIYGGAGDFLRCNRELAGQIVGGATGAVVGSTIGKGDGRLIATGAGALIGVLLGGEIGRSLDGQDRACVGRTLETVPTGRTVAWRNPDTGGTYRTTPTETFQTRSGQYCREYTTTARVAGRQQQVYGTACRRPDGSWEIVSRKTR
jgi:surface antigen